MEVKERLASEAETRPLKQVGLWELVRYFLRLGAFGFGPPNTLSGSLTTLQHIIPFSSVLFLTPQAFARLGLFFALIGSRFNELWRLAASR
jgi:hypothetical protein